MFLDIVYCAYALLNPKIWQYSWSIIRKYGNKFGIEVEKQYALQRQTDERYMIQRTLQSVIANYIGKGKVILLVGAVRSLASGESVKGTGRQLPVQGCVGDRGCAEVRRLAKTADGVGVAGG